MDCILRAKVARVGGLNLPVGDIIMLFILKRLFLVTYYLGFLLKQSRHPPRLWPPEPSDAVRRSPELCRSQIDRIPEWRGKHALLAPFIGWADLAVSGDIYCRFYGVMPKS